MDTHRQVFGNNRTTTGACLRSAAWVDLHYHPTSVCSFVGGELYELTPCNIRNAPANCLVAVDLHILNVEFLKSDELVFIHQLARFLVSEVVASIRRSFIGVTKGFDDLASCCATFGKLFLLALQSGNVASILLHPALAINLVAIAEIGKGRQAQIDTNNVGCWFKRCRFTLTGKASVPVANRITLNGQGLNVGTDGTVQLDPNVTDFGNSELVAYQLEARLLEGERIVPTVALKTWVARGFPSFDTSKERFESQFHPLLHVLQDLGMNLFQRWSFSLPLCEKFVRIIQAQRLTRLLVGVSANCQRIIVDAAARLKHSIQACSLGIGWKKAVLKC